MSLGTAEQPAVTGSGERRSRAPFQESTVASTDRVISMKATLAITGWSRSSIYRLVEKRAFPQPVKMGASKIGFVEREVREYLASKVRGRDEAPLLTREPDVNAAAPGQHHKTQRPRAVRREGRLEFKAAAHVYRVQLSASTEGRRFSTRGEWWP